MLMSTTVSGTVMLKISLVVTYDTNSAWMPPAQPASAHEIASAPSFQRYVGTPITSAASSSSWIANRPAPNFEWRMPHDTSSVTQAATSIIMYMLDVAVGPSLGIGTAFRYTPGPPSMRVLPMMVARTKVTASVSSANSSPRTPFTRKATAPTPTPITAATSAAIGNVQRKVQPKVTASVAAVYTPAPWKAPWPNEK
jgi:hypothetical protein